MEFGFIYILLRFVEGGVRKILLERKKTKAPILIERTKCVGEFL